MVSTAEPWFWISACVCWQVMARVSGLAWARVVKASVTAAEVNAIRQMDMTRLPMSHLVDKLACRRAAVQWRLQIGIPDWGKTGWKPMPATKHQWKAFREELSQQLEDERRFIANAEAGKTGIWTVEPGKGKVDTTAAHVEISRRAVQALEGVIAKIDQDHLAE
ncbi:hypothetical protein [Mesorhizobium sp.]|uniref:hypothetical protein n=1 Tax=Mesorhizobium sp. TaxID=1871066 RepID=UPI00338E285D